MNNTGDLTIKKTWDYINKIKKEQADKWVQENEKILNKKQEFINEYYRLKEERRLTENAISELFESYKTSLLETAFKAVYISALDPDTLTEQGIILAEDMVNKYIKENGGATKIMNKNSGKTYFLDMLFSKINETAKIQLDNLLSGKTEAAEIYDIEESDENEKESFIRGIGETKETSSFFRGVVLEEDEDNSGDSDSEDTEPDDPMSDPDLGETEIEDDEEDTSKDNSEEDEDNSDEEDTSEDNDDEDTGEEEDEEIAKSYDNNDEVVDSEKDDPMGDTDSEDDREAPESSDNEDDDEVVVDDDGDGVDDNADASEEKDLRDDLSSDEKQEVDPSKKTDTEFLQDLDKEEDVKKAVELIRSRVANAEEEFIKRNAEDKKKINDLLGKISDNVKVVKDISVNDSDKSVGDEVVNNDSEETSTEESTKITIANERINACKNMIHDISENKTFTVYEKFVRNMTNSIMKNKAVRESYMDGNELDLYAVMESCKVMYGWLETVNTLQLESVDKDYVKKVLEDIR